MKSGLWVWPASGKAQKKLLKRVGDSPHLMAALTALNKNKDGLSNSELDFALGDNSEFMTLWVVRQLTSLGLIEFKVDFFGGPAKYQITEAGKIAFTTITGVPPAPPPRPQPAPAPQTAAPQTPAPPAPAPVPTPAPAAKPA
ncbi:MAG TPA: hypothetical protein VFE91_00800 [Nitrososphaerales archaeon]|nr:hypothetical protein [Nitrososphaerales archaeon]